MSDVVADLQPGWEAAIAACLAGHDTCTYGGMSPSGGYWLADADCPLDHGDRCAWCPEPATTGFAGWADDGFAIYAVPTCQGHADRWTAEHPEWLRRSERPKAEEPETLAELLAGLSPIARTLAEEHHAAMGDALLYGMAGIGGEPNAPRFTGIGELLRGVLAPPSSDGPPYVHDLTARPCAPCSESCETDPCGCACHRPKPSFTIETVEQP